MVTLALFCESTISKVEPIRLQLSNDRTDFLGAPTNSLVSPPNSPSWTGLVCPVVYKIQENRHMFFGFLLAKILLDELHPAVTLLKISIYLPVALPKNQARSQGLVVMAIKGTLAEMLVQCQGGTSACRWVWQPLVLSPGVCRAHHLKRCLVSGFPEADTQHG